MKEDVGEGAYGGNYRRKIGSGTKIAVGTAAVGTAIYLGARKIWKHIYPPTFKKYLSMAVMASALLCIRNCSTVSHKLDSAYRGVSKSISLRIERAPQMKSLEAKINELMAENNILREQNQEAKEVMEKKGYTLKSDLEKQIETKESVLVDAKKYIISLERDYFNYKSSTKADPKRPGRLIQVNNPSKEAFQDFLLYKKDYNSIIYKIDKEIKDR